MDRGQRCRRSAYILAQRRRTGLSRVDNLTHAQTRAHAGDLRAGGKGTVHAAGGNSQHQPDPQTTISEKHADIFSKQVANRLKAGFNDNAFDALVIAADSSFLGRLREHLNASLDKAIARTIDKNWAQHNDRTVQQLLDKRLGG